MTRLWLIPCLGLVLAVVASPPSQAQPEPAKPAPAPDFSGYGVEDPAFDRYADLALLGEAWADLDSGLFTDVVLQMAEGERILLRPHKSGVSVERLLPVALKLAVETRDSKSLDRLERVAARTGAKELAAQVALAKKFAAAPRRAGLAPPISLRTTAPATLAAYQSTQKEIRTARIAGDRKALVVLERSLPGVVDLTDPLRGALKKQLTEALQAVGETPAPAPLFGMPAGPATVADRHGNEFLATSAGGDALQIAAQFTLRNATKAPVTVSFHGAGHRATLKPGEKGTYVVYGSRPLTEEDLEEGAPGPYVVLTAGPKGAGTNRAPWSVANGDFEITGTPADGFGLERAGEPEAPPAGGAEKKKD